MAPQSQPALEIGEHPVTPGDRSVIAPNYKNIVTRHRKFTKEFERNLAKCCTKLNEVANRSHDKDLLHCLSSVYNNSLTLNDLDMMRGNYEECDICVGVYHPKVSGVPQPKKRGSQESQSSDEEDRARMSHLRRFVNRLNHRRSLQDIFFHPTTNVIQKFRYIQRSHSRTQDRINVEIDKTSGISDCVIYVVKSRDGDIKQTYADVIKNMGRDCATWFTERFLPLFRLFSVTILITLVQWFLFMFRVFYYRLKYKPSIEMESLTFGVFSGRLLRDELAVYRIISSTFFHNSLGHLIISTIMHFRFSSVFERIHGATTTLVVYFLSSAYGMVAVCWNIPRTFQANGFCGDWGVAGALLSRFFIFPYLLDREHNHLIHIFASFICLLFVKNIESGSTIVIATHLIAAFGGYCFGIMIYSRLRDGKCCGLNNILVDFFCSFALLGVTVASIFMLFLVKPSGFTGFIK